MRKTIHLNEPIEQLLDLQMNICAKRNDYEKLGILCRKILSIDPKNAKAWHNLGHILASEKFYTEALEAYQKAIDLKPLHMWQSYCNQSEVLLKLGHLKKGFALYEYRLKLCHTKPTIKTKNKSRLWQGEDISGQTLLVHKDGGLGDSIHFLRYIPYLSKYNCKLVLYLHSELNCLFKNLPVPLITNKSLPIEYDVHVFMNSLPYCFKTDFSTIPPPIKIECNRAPIKGRIGIVWKSGCDKHDHNTDKRSIPLNQLIPLFALSKCHYVSVQKVVCEKDIKLLNNYGVEQPHINTFMDTVRVLETCQSVISVDTSVAHLSASMEIPTSILLCYNPCWRWWVDRQDSPWYPTAQLFRQKTPNVWDDPIKEIAQYLQKEAL